MFCRKTIIENNEFLENYTLIYSFIPDQLVGLDTVGRAGFILNPRYRE